MLEINRLDKIARRSKRVLVGGAIADLWGSHLVGRLYGEKLSLTEKSISRVTYGKREKHLIKGIFLLHVRVIYVQKPHTKPHTSTCRTVICWFHHSLGSGPWCYP